jgi:hypothetical protein
MAKVQELTVITKTYDLILWSRHHTSRFPRNQWFVLCEGCVPFRCTWGYQLVLFDGQHPVKSTVIGGFNRSEPEDVQEAQGLEKFAWEQGRCSG